MLNEPRYQGAQILLARRNFGCGSSREHAPWALADYGFRALIAPSYADIFFNNCYKNGLLPIVLSEVAGRPAVRRGPRVPGLPADHRPRAADGRDARRLDGASRFDVEPFRKHCLLHGLDDIGLTLQHADAIREFEAKRLAEQPWLV